MAQRYKIVGSVADGTHYTETLSADFQSGVFVIAFYDASGNAATPTAGTITPAMSPIKGQWHAPSSGDAIIDAVKCKKESDGVATYNIPVFVAEAIQGKLTLAGITGTATTFEAHFWRVS